MNTIAELQIFGIRMVGVNWENGKKLLLTVALIVILMLISKLLRAVTRGVSRRSERIAFWVRQAIHVFTAVVLILGVVSIWFAKSESLVMVGGLFTAGLAFALQRVITAIAGYVVILRGKTFSVGDRIMMGGVRGDVVALGFIQTTIMEMGQAPREQQDDPGMWVRARQYTGRIVSVSNAKIFDEPIYNYSRDFPYLWEEITVPVSYKDDRAIVERTLLETAQKHTVKIADLSEEALKEMERRFVMRRPDLRPRVYLRMTDNWVELTVRFIAEDHAIRELKDAMSREILAALDKASIGIASSTFEIVGLPPLRINAVNGMDQYQAKQRA